MPRRASMSSTTSSRRTSNRMPVPRLLQASSSSSSTPTSNKRAKTNASSVATTQLTEEREEEEEEEGGQGSSETKSKSTSTNNKRKAPVVVSLPKLPKPIKIISGINSIQPIFPINSTDKPRGVFFWGDGGSNQLGSGTDYTDEVTRPELHKWVQEKIRGDGVVAVKGWERGMADLQCGGMHSIGLDGEGNVWTWGANDAGSLGRITDIPGEDSDELEASPGLVESLREEGFTTVKLSAGDSHSLAISDKGQLRAWGSFRNSEGPLGFNSDPSSSKIQFKPVALPNLDSHTIVNIASGDDHFLALTSDGRVFACGNSEQHQLGRKVVQRHKTHGLTPERLSIKNIVLIGCGSYHSFAVDSEGVVSAFGLNSFHQTGVTGNEEMITSPTQVESLHPSKHNGAKVIQIAGGGHHSLFLFSNGEVWGCGRCDGSEIGLGPDHPEMLAMVARKDAALAIRAERRIFETARLITDEGMTPKDAAHKAEELAAQLIELPNDYITLPTLISFPNSTIQEGQNSKIIQIAAGTKQNFAVSEDGELFAWGYGNTGQLGLGSERNEDGDVEEVEEAKTPRKVKSKLSAGEDGIQNWKVLSVSSGGQHTLSLAVRKD